ASCSDRVAETESGSTSKLMTSRAPARWAQRENRPLPHPISRNTLPLRSDSISDASDSAAILSRSGVRYSETYRCQFWPNRNASEGGPMLEFAWVLTPRVTGRGYDACQGLRGATSQVAGAP